MTSVHGGTLPGAATARRAERHRSARPSGALRVSAPWTRANLLCSAGLAVAGSVVWTLGWFGVANGASMEDQIAPFNLAVVGVAAIAAGQLLWISTARRTVTSRRRALLRLARLSTSAPTTAGVNADVVLGGESFYHRANCPMVDDRNWEPSTVSAQRSQGRVPCGVCAP